MNDEDALNDFEVEITDLDSDYERSRASALWFYSQRLWSQARLWMVLLTVVGVAILGVMILPPVFKQLPHQPGKAPAIPAIQAPQQEDACITIVMVASVSYGNKHWGKAGSGMAASCARIIDVSKLSGSDSARHSPSTSWIR